MNSERLITSHNKFSFYIPLLVQVKPWEVLQRGGDVRQGIMCQAAQHNAKERLFKYVTAYIPALLRLIWYKTESREKERSEASESSSFHLEQLDRCYSKHREGNEERILYCSSSQTRWVWVNQGSDRVCTGSCAGCSSLKKHTIWICEFIHWVISEMYVNLNYTLSRQAREQRFVFPHGSDVCGCSFACRLSL